MWLSWFPWKFIVSRLAKQAGFVDPVKVLFRLEAFAQPLETKKPLEMLRSGMILHARGILNTGAIQHNLDWIWPYWVECQYNPRNEAFIPRAFSLSHINLTHRNWTAVGLPDCDEYPIVDPRGLVTPFWDSWSLDTWMIGEDRSALFPSKLDAVDQRLDLAGGLAVVTCSRRADMEIESRAEMLWDEKAPHCVLSISAKSPKKAWLVVSLRPYNPEGVSFINTIALDEPAARWKVGRQRHVCFEPPADRYRFCYYHKGDVHTQLFVDHAETSVTCRVGMATAAAMFAVAPGAEKKVRIRVPLLGSAGRPAARRVAASWPQALAGSVSLRLPEKKLQDLFAAALHTLVLHSPGEVYPGPYTYKRFWFRDAAFILHALLCVGLIERVERVLDTYPARQTARGFFLSQEGEWDSNGQALWILKRFCDLSGQPPKTAWQHAIEKGAQWIVRKRRSEKLSELHAGLLPPGFSAEHLGPNDYYFWDNFWGVAGLQAAAGLCAALDAGGQAARFGSEAEQFLAAITRCLAKVEGRNGRRGMPASVYRRMDSGAIGSLAAGYPLQIFDPKDRRLLDTAGFLMDNCRVKGGFFLDIIHSGINPYLTLHLAQVLMRAGDPRCFDLLRAVADQASATGQWPEAIHPRTLGGCMGDGNHVWAAAEWVLMVRNGFVREEGQGLILGAGIPPEWCRPSEAIFFGPAPTSFGPVRVAIQPGEEKIEVAWEGAWRKSEPAIGVAVPGFETVFPPAGQTSVVLRKDAGS
jgi:hypothetical protein